MPCLEKGDFGHFGLRSRTHYIVKDDLEFMTLLSQCCDDGYVPRVLCTLGK